MKLACFTVQGNSIYINPDMVVTINAYPKGGTVLTTVYDVGDEYRILDEDVDTVYERLTSE
jgi:uncharacterized protein YlzI (FlbEa/FlbD family)